MTTSATPEQVKTFVSDYWNGRAAAFDQAPNHAWQTPEQKQAWLDLLVDLAGPAPIPALDLGCGTGFLALLLAELGHQVTGVDIAPDMLARAEQKGVAAKLPVTWRLGDVETLPEPDKTYRLITGRHLIWTLPNPTGALAEWHRVLQSGGKLALFEFGTHWGPDTTARTGQPEYQPYKDQLPYFGGTPGETLAAAYTAAGFTNVEVRSTADARLWGGAASEHRYLVLGTKA